MVTSGGRRRPWAPHSERNPFVTLRKITEGWQRPLALVVGRLDVAASQEHQHFVARPHGNGRPAAGCPRHRLRSEQAIQLAVKAAPID